MSLVSHVVPSGLQQYLPQLSFARWHSKHALQAGARMPAQWPPVSLAALRWSPALPRLCCHRRLLETLATRHSLQRLSSPQLELQGASMRSVGPTSAASGRAWFT